MGVARKTGGCGDIDQRCSMLSQKRLSALQAELDHKAMRSLSGSCAKHADEMSLTITSLGCQRAQIQIGIQILHALNDTS